MTFLRLQVPSGYISDFSDIERNALALLRIELRTEPCLRLRLLGVRLSALRSIGKEHSSSSKIGASLQVAQPSIEAFAKLSGNDPSAAAPSRPDCPVCGKQIPQGVSTSVHVDACLMKDGTTSSDASVRRASGYDESAAVPNRCFSKLDACIPKDRLTVSARPVVDSGESSGDSRAAHGSIQYASAQVLTTQRSCLFGGASVGGMLQSEPVTRGYKNDSILPSDEVVASCPVCSRQVPLSNATEHVESCLSHSTIREILKNDATAATFPQRKEVMLHSGRKRRRGNDHVATGPIDSFIS